MIDADIATLGASKVVDGVPLWQSSVPVGDSTEDVESFGEAPVFQALGLTALQHPADATGAAQAVFLKGCGGYDAVCIGARDARNADFVGNMKPGNTTLHDTGPGAVSQVFCKDHQVGMATENEAGRSLLLMLDGKNKKFQLAVSGAMIEIAEDGSITFAAKGGATLKLDDKAYLLCDLSLQGMNPGMVLMQGSPAGQTPPTPVLLLPVLGVGK